MENLICSNETITRRYTDRRGKNPTEKEITVDLECEHVEPEPIFYKYGNCCMFLNGFLAFLYRGMVGMYGEETANERFYYIFHDKNESPFPPEPKPKDPEDELFEEFLEWRNTKKAVSATTQNTAKKP